MMVPDPVDVSQLLVDGTSFGLNELGELEKAISSNPHAVRQACQELRRRVDSGSGSERDFVAIGYNAASVEQSSGRHSLPVSGNSERICRILER